MDIDLKHGIDVNGDPEVTIFIDDQEISKHATIDIAIDTKEFKRAALHNRVSRDYDKTVRDGFDIVATSMSGSPTLKILERDVERLGLAAGTLALAVADGSMLITDIGLTYYKFDDSIVTNITLQQLLQINSLYISSRTNYFEAHTKAKDSIISGRIPEVSDYTLCGLIADDFNGLQLI